MAVITVILILRGKIAFCKWEFAQTEMEIVLCRFKQYLLSAHGIGMGWEYGQIRLNSHTSKLGKAKTTRGSVQAHQQSSKRPSQGLHRHRASTHKPVGLIAVAVHVAVLEQAALQRISLLAWSLQRISLLACSAWTSSASTHKPVGLIASTHKPVGLIASTHKPYRWYSAALQRISLLAWSLQRISLLALSLEQASWEDAMHPVMAVLGHRLHNFFQGRVLKQAMLEMSGADGLLAQRNICFWWAGAIEPGNSLEL
jgi:hypothetical protein